MNHNRIGKFLSIAGLACLVAAPAAFADRGAGSHGKSHKMHGGEDHDCHGKHGRRGGPRHGVIHDLLDPCGAACDEQARVCRQGAKDEVAACGQSSCANQIGAARAACPAGQRPRRSGACGNAMDALLQCMGACFDGEDSTFEACRDTASTCHDTCRSATGS